MVLTRHTHFIPCFWTAYWNTNFYQLATQNAIQNLKPREQQVFSLNLHANKILETKVNKVFYEKNLGIAQITYDAAIDFCRREYPNKYAEFKKKSKEEDYPLILDFENIFTGLENTSAYKTLISVIKQNNINTKEEKAFLADFIFLQLLRSLVIMNSTIQINEQFGFEKFEYLVKLKWFLSSAEATYPIVARIALSHWVVYITEKDYFPICDSPILVNNNDIMVALSPKLLLVVQLMQPSDKWEFRRGISSEKYQEFKKRTINNAFREIVFSQNHLLQKWQLSKPFLNRIGKISKINTIIDLLSDRQDDLWLLNSANTQKDWLIKAHSIPSFFQE